MSEACDQSMQIVQIIRSLLSFVHLMSFPVRKDGETTLREKYLRESECGTLYWYNDSSSRCEQEIGIGDFIIWKDTE